MLTMEEEVLNITLADPTHQGGYACKAHLETRGVTSGFSNTVDVTVYGELSCPCIALHTLYMNTAILKKELEKAYICKLNIKPL